MATSTSLTLLATKVRGTLGTTVSTASVLVNFVYYKDPCSWWTLCMVFDYVLTEWLGLAWRWDFVLLGWCLDYLDFFDVVPDGFDFGTGWGPDYLDSFGFVLDGFDFGKGWCSEYLDSFDFVLGGFGFGARSPWPKCSTSSPWLRLWGLTAT